jgi:hypothetical protein
MLEYYYYYARTNEHLKKTLILFGPYFKLPKIRPKMKEYYTIKDERTILQTITRRKATELVKYCVGTAF